MCMLKQVSSFIVNKRRLILCVMLLAAVASIFMMGQVNINEDMTEYLPDDSAMKAGVDIMSEEFPEMETSQTIRVMFDDIDEAHKNYVLEKLEALPYVDSVAYEADSEDYNKENHTLFVVNTKYAYGSEEELSIEAALEENFIEYTMSWHNDDTSTGSVPTWIIVAVIVILMAILFVMCGSWIEPILFLAVIGIAVVINMGTNLLLGSVSSVTFSIAAILQLVLSMDYSIILINHYRQEKERIDDNKLAMKEAWSHAFSSIASSSMTTVVGLLMLAFMSFKIGLDLGAVLAKGVFISMVCVLTMLPAIILACDKLIQKTSKKELHIPMNWAAGLSYKLRYALGGLFVVLFVGVYLLQGHTGISYTLLKEDPVADVFPANNTLVMVYENQDEDAVGQLAAKLEEDEHVKSVMGYSTMLAKPYTAAEFADEIAAMGDDFSLDSSVINMLYYDYFKDGKTDLMTASDFLDFVSGTVMENETFSEYVDEGMRENIGLIKKFADADALTTPMNAEELAAFFDMDASNVENLMLFYYIKNGGVPTENMTLATFADFVINEVAKDETYGSMFDADTLKQMEQLVVFTDAAKMTTAYDYKGIASLLGMDADTVKLLFVYYYALSDSYTLAGMTLTDFISYIRNDVASDPTFGSAFDADTLAQMNMLAQFTDIGTMQKQISPAELAGLLNMDESMVRQIFMIYYGGERAEQGISFTAFTNFLANNILQNPRYSAAFDENVKAQIQQMNQIAATVASGQVLTYQQMAHSLGMDEAQLRQMYVLYWGQDITGKTLSLEQTITFLLSDPAMSGSLDEAARQQLSFLQTIMSAAKSGKIYSHTEMGALLGMDSSMVKTLYTYREPDNAAGDWALSMHTIINFLVDNKEQLGSMMGNAMGELQTTQKLINGSVSGASYSASSLASLMGMETEQAQQLYLLYTSRHGDTSGWQLSVKGFIDFIIRDVLNDPDFAGQFDEETFDMLGTAQTLTAAVISGKSYTAAQTSEMFAGLSEDLDQNMIDLLYLYASSDKNSDPAWEMSIEMLFNYLVEDVLNDARFVDLLDDEMRKSLYEAQAELTDGKTQLVTDRYSRLIVTTGYPEESTATTAFLDQLNIVCGENLSGDYYLVGNSAMTYEMQKIFDNELLFITLLTTIAIFLIVALTFKSIFIPLILVLIVQCGVYATISIIGLQGGSMYYLALLIVECILMGATIDYGILFTNYYIKNRAALSVKEALKAAYAGSTHTILTSGLILIVVTAIVGNFFEEPTVAAIVKTVSTGALCATLLILFVLPGLLAVCDRFVVRKKKG